MCRLRHSVSFRVTVILKTIPFNWVFIKDVCSKRGLGYTLGSKFSDRRSGWKKLENFAVQYEWSLCNAMISKSKEQILILGVSLCSGLKILWKNKPNMSTNISKTKKKIFTNHFQILPSLHVKGFVGRKPKQTNTTSSDQPVFSIFSSGTKV